MARDSNIEDFHKMWWFSYQRYGLMFQWLWIEAYDVAGRYSCVWVGASNV